MKKVLLFSIMLLGAMLMPQIVKAQTTEGSDFYVTFLQGDNDESKNHFTLSLSISAREDCEVTIENPNPNCPYTKTINILANQNENVKIYDYDRDGGPVSDRTKNTAICYSNQPEKIDSTALHVTVKDGKKISLYATNYKRATFDATNVLPTDALQDKYLIQCYTPSDHDGESDSQGTHFAIVAVEDSTRAEYILSADSWYGNHHKGDTVRTDIMKKGQVWYVWTGSGYSGGFGHPADLSGTRVRAYNAYDTTKVKPIAVFQGNPHTNIPFYQDIPALAHLRYSDKDEQKKIKAAVGERDHIFSQAMPITTWGTTFALTTSEKRDRDIIRVMAVDDGTELYLNGDMNNPIHVFDFSQEEKQYWEFEIGVDGVTNARDASGGNFFAGSSFYLQSSCPVSVHEFIVSKNYGKDNKSNGDPAMLWVNPIEQRIDQITFATYASSNGTTYNYTNIITTADNVNSMTLDGRTTTLDGSQSLASQFYEIAGTSEYKYAKLDLGSVAGTHTLAGDPKKGFIAHVYGLTGNESYGYNAGGSAKPLNSVVTINGDTLQKGEKTQICRSTIGSNMIKFTCQPDSDHTYKRITWFFGDGTPLIYGHKENIESGPLPEGTTGTNIEELYHNYEKDSVYQAYVVLERDAATGNCSNISPKDSFPMEVTLDALHLTYEPIKDHICVNSKDFRIYYQSNRSLTGSNMDVKYYKDGAETSVFGAPDMQIDEEGKTYFKVTMPSSGINDGDKFAIHIEMETKCDTPKVDIPFAINYTAENILAQRWTNTIATWTVEEMMKHMADKGAEWAGKVVIFDEYQWFQRDTTLLANERYFSPLNGYNFQSFLVQSQVPANKEFYVDIYYTVKDQTTGTIISTDTISSCPISFAKTTVLDKYFDDAHNMANPESVGDIIIKRAYNHMLVMSAKDGTAEWLNSQGDKEGNSYNIKAGGTLIPLPSNDGFHILHVEAGKSEKSMKIVINR